MRKTLWCGAWSALLLLLIPLAVSADWAADAKAQMAQRQYEKALAIFDAHAADVSTPDLLCLRGEARFELGRLQDAAADVTKALAQNDRHVDCHVVQSLLHSKERRTAKAKEHADQAIAAGKTARAVYALGIAELGAGRLDQALAALNESVALDPAAPDAYLARGAIYRYQGKFTESAQQFELALARDKRPYKVYLERATLAVLQGDPTRAKADIKQAVDLAPEMYHGYLGRAFIYQEYGDIEAALADFTKGAELAPQVSELFLAKANLLVNLQRFTEAEKTLQAGRNACQEVPEFYYMLSLVQGTLNQPDAAMATLNELLRRLPDHWQGYNLRGQLHASLNKFDEALADFEKAHTLAPKAMEPLLNEVAVLAATQKTEQAVTVINQVVADHPNQVLPLQIRMQLFEALGRNAEALADLERIQALKQGQKSAPTNP
jgi:tetratricopeptide (TPR) repeat protein